MRMFVSTKYLTLMELVPRLGYRPLQIKAFAQPSERAAARLIEGFSFSDDGFQAIGQQSADRAAFFGRDHAGFQEQIGIELHSHVCFHAAPSTGSTCCTVLRAQVRLGKEAIHREMNQLRMEHRATLTAAEREIERIEVRRKKLVQSIIDGVPAREVRDELTANAAKREELKAKLAAADAPPPLLHPEMADLYRQKVTTLARALERPETCVEATEALRGFIDAIIPTPTDAELKIELKGNLAAMLSAATNAKRSPETGDLSLQVEMVAGARNKLYRQLCWAAA